MRRYRSCPLVDDVFALSTTGGGDYLSLFYFSSLLVPVGLGLPLQYRGRDMGLLKWAGGQAAFMLAMVFLWGPGFDDRAVVHINVWGPQTTTTSPYLL